MTQYSFLDTNFWKEKDSKGDVWHDSYESKSLDSIEKSTGKGILDPDWQIVKVKDIEKGS